MQTINDEHVPDINPDHLGELLETKNTINLCKHQSKRATNYVGVALLQNPQGNHALRVSLCTWQSCREGWGDLDKIRGTVGNHISVL